jgi:hypothetical protein
MSKHNKPKHVLIRVIENPIDPLIEILGLTIGENCILKIPETDDVLSIYPEYLSPYTARTFYGKDKVLVFNCAIIKDGNWEKPVYIEIKDEKEFYAFMSQYKDKRHFYRRPTDIEYTKLL